MGCGLYIATGLVIVAHFGEINLFECLTFIYTKAGDKQTR